MKIRDKNGVFEAYDQDSGNLMGRIVYRENGNTVNVNLIAVHKDHRREGIGTELTKLFEGAKGRPGITIEGVTDTDHAHSHIRDMYTAMNYHIGEEVRPGRVRLYKEF